MKYSKGSSLIEILLYIALYAILFTGYMSFIFSFQKVIISYEKRYQDISVIYMITSLLTEYIDMSSEYIVTEHSIVLKNGKTLDITYFNNLFDIPLERIEFKKENMILICTIYIHSKEYNINIHLI